MEKTKRKIAVIGGGVAGSSIALHLGEVGLHVTLFERKSSLVDGPPICHLHAGGNLYREISDAQCVALLGESIELARLYPFAIDKRPTVIAIPTYDKGEVQDLLPRLELLQEKYQELISKDSKNLVLGEAKRYFTLFSEEQMQGLSKKESVTSPKSFEDWMIPVAKNIDLEKVKYPLVMVQEYGINIFRLAASVSLALENLSNVDVKLQTQVVGMEENANGYKVHYKQNNENYYEQFDFVVNAAGFRTGEIDDMLYLKRERFVEFKAAYVTEWENKDMWPEVIFHGRRGTPQGMAQFTPYADGCVQLHGMSEEITLFKDGLVKSSQQSAQPKLDEKFIKKIDIGWNEIDTKSRTNSAIEYLAKFIPLFKDAKVVSQPLYGAQQIPGNDASLRAVGVSFEGTRYARCENVKASSVLGMGDEILHYLYTLGFVDTSAINFRNFQSNQSLNNERITEYATDLCHKRGYPLSMGKCYSDSVI